MARGKFAAFVLSLILSSAVSWAQGARNKEAVITPSATSQKALVRHAFENELQGILQKYLKPHQYAMDISFKMPANVKGIGDVPYAPDSIVPESFQGLPDAGQLKKLQDLNVKILVPQWMDAQTKATLQNLLSKRLEQITGTAVPLALQSVTLNVEEPARPLPGMNLPAMPGATDQSREIEELKAQILKEREQFREELRELQDKVAGNPQDKPGTLVPASSSNVFQNFWEFAKGNPIGAGVVLLLIYGGIFTLAFLPSRSMASGLGSIQNAFGAIAKSIKGVADSMARSSSSSSGSYEAAERPVTPAVSAPLAGAAVASSKSQLPSYPELREMLQELQKQHKVQSDPIVMEMLQGFLTQGDQAFKAVLVLELLGPQHANRIFDQLPSDHKDQLLRLIQRAEHAVADKTEALYELAEAYQTRLMASGWKGGTRATLSEDLQRLIAGLKADEVSYIARQLKDEDSLRRYMLYLDASMLVQLIQSFKRQPQDKDLILKSLAAMPEALDAGHTDRSIEAIIQQYLTRKREDRYLPYLTQYESIIAQSGEDMEDELIEQISRSNPAVGRHLRRRVVTLGSFFALPESVRADLLEPFSNYELAALTAAFADEEKRSLLLHSVDSRRRELVQEQMHMLVDENKYALAETQRHQKARLKEAMRLARANQSEDEEEAVQEDHSTASDAAA
jgi:flagellar motor switch protein FliG